MTKVKTVKRPLMTLTLDSREVAILNLRTQGKSLNEIGRIYSLTKQRIEQIERIIGRKLALPKYKDHKYRIIWNAWNKKQSLQTKIYITENRRTYSRLINNWFNPESYLRKII